MASLTFKQKMWLPVLCSLLCLTGMAVFDAIQLRGIRVEERQHALADMTEAALHMVVRYARQAERGERDTPTAQRQAMAALDSVRYGDGSYVSLLRADGVVLQNPGTMAQVVHSVGGVTAVMAAISDASREQSTGIGHVNQAMTEMDGVTQQNAALVEEAAAAAGSMQDQAGYLTRCVAVFRL